MNAEPTIGYLEKVMTGEDDFTEKISVGRLIELHFDDDNHVLGIILGVWASKPQGVTYWVLSDNSRCFAWVFRDNAKRFQQQQVSWTVI